jgi:hypothetical protein
MLTVHLSKNWTSDQGERLHKQGCGFLQAVSRRDAASLIRIYWILLGSTGRSDELCAFRQLHRF